jgi:hypothetical protein
VCVTWPPEIVLHIKLERTELARVRVRECVSLQVLYCFLGHLCGVCVRVGETVTNRYISLVSRMTVREHSNPVCMLTFLFAFG